MRIGQGYDIHQLEEGRKLIIGGVEIPNDKGLIGHSDADVLVHAIIDSLFGALAMGDIGEHFPDSWAKFKNADSLGLLKKTAEIIKEKKYRVVNIDTTIICEKPKLKTYKLKMRENIARALDIDVEDVSIKAKTNEKMDAAGEEKAIEAHAVCLIEKFRMMSA